jgi:hypothetical protein
MNNFCTVKFENSNYLPCGTTVLLYGHSFAGFFVFKKGGAESGSFLLNVEKILN